MNDLDRIRVLRERLSDFERRPVTTENRSMLEIARQSLCTEISELGLRLQRHFYWKPGLARG